ncbi:MAG: bifunctional 5,10-methylenetetrahydrofolate dehydrogenase/5,10-methenyltetrahydrofolate cyclohydrolase [bacterium]|nr:bifunctional 5,10-methylenetetrahydrofolate dehydrogenase/5,10-methenyltetrahydrofolate cyclohydrolase [bacterium]
MILDGRSIANRILKSLEPKIKQLKHTPKLSIILSTQNPDQVLYVNSKIKKAAQLGIESIVFNLKEEDKIISKLQELKESQDICGIVVQLPLPEYINTEKVVMNIAIEKDVDGLHPLNQGRIIWSRSIEELFSKDIFLPPATVAIFEILKNYEVQVKNRNVVILNFSPLIGKPLSFILYYMGANVSIVNINNENWKDITKNADIIITAIGKPGIINRDSVSKNAIILDAGISIVAKITGDCAFDDLKDYVKALTPVPGGVGAVTTAVILENLYKACYKLHR